jgi:hypothetical protein
MHFVLLMLSKLHFGAIGGEILAVLRLDVRLSSVVIYFPASWLNSLLLVLPSKNSTTSKGRQDEGR